MKNGTFYKYEISVGIISFNPKWEKLLKTVTSIINQKNIKIQLIIADDGSYDNYFNEIEKFLKKEGFSDYCLIDNPTNQGTVKNCLSAVQHAEYSVVKLIGPGDYFSSDTMLYEWVDWFMVQGASWSFCDAYYYFESSSGEISLKQCKANPKCITPYKEMKIDKIRWYYVAYGDLCLGAVTLFKKEILLKYLDIIQNRVVYAEDNILSLMMLDRISVVYFDKHAVVYEYGSGISTNSNSLWQKKIRKDYEQTCQIMLERIKESNQSDWLIRGAIRVNKIENRWIRVVVKSFLPFYLLYRIRKGRKTPSVWLEE